MTNTVVFPHLAISCKMLGIKHCWFIHEIPDVTWLNLNPVLNFVLSLERLINYQIRYW